MSVDDLLQAARTWLGTPYAHQGRSRFGVDCIGYPIAVFHELNLLPAKFTDHKRYGRTPDGQMEPLVAQYCTRAAAPAPGTLVLIKWPMYKVASHAAICTGLTMIHAHQRAGKVVENGFRGPWRKNVSSVWRLPGISYE